MKTYVDFKLDKNLSSELLNMDKIYDFVIKPLKKWPPRSSVEHGGTGTVSNFMDPLAL